MDRLLLTVDQAAERLGLSRAHIYPWVLSGDLPSLKLGRSRRIPVAALEEFIQRRLAETSLIESSDLLQQAQ